MPSPRDTTSPWLLTSMFLSTAQNHPWAPDLYTWVATIITCQHGHNWNDTLQTCFSPRSHTSIKHAVRQFAPQANMLVIYLLPFLSQVHPISEIYLQVLFFLGSVSAPWLHHLWSQLLCCCYYSYYQCIAT